MSGCLYVTPDLGFGVEFEEEVKANPKPKKTMETARRRNKFLEAKRIILNGLIQKKRESVIDFCETIKVSGKINSDCWIIGKIKMRGDF